MTGAADRHQDQVSYWNSAGGERWAGAQDHTDTMLAPVARILMEHAQPQPGTAVLDIGCGAGTTTFEAAKAAGPEGRAIGVDVSEQLIALARARFSGLSHLRFVNADAASYRFDRFADLAISRFGVMFFGDPAAAFSNIGEALKPGARLVFACWRDLDDNAWMKVPLKAVYSSGVPALPRPGQDDPGPFSFANPERVKRVLAAAGFQGVTLTPAGVSLDIAAGKGLPAAVQQATSIGAAAAALREEPDDRREAAASRVEEALAPYAASDGSVALPGSIWLVEGRACA